MKRLALLLLVLAPSSAFAQPSIYGFTLPSWNRDGYDSPAAQKSVSDMAATGAKWIAIVPTWYMKDRKSSLIAPAPEKSASDDSIVRLIRRAKSLGLRVILKPHVNTLSETPTALIGPSDERLWFSQYRAFLLHFARIAQAEHADLFVVGTELFSMSVGHGRQWEALIAETRGVYSGKLTYAANFYDFPLMPFWGSLDYVGVDAYFPLAGGKSAAWLAASWKAYLPALRGMIERSGKPLLFTEIGISSQKGASIRPWDYGKFGPADPATQAAFFQAFIDVFRDEPNFAGFLQWCWDLDPKAGGPGDTSMTVQGKPALAVLEKYFAELNGTEKPRPATPSLQQTGERVLRLFGALNFAGR